MQVNVFISYIQLNFRNAVSPMPICCLRWNTTVLSLPTSMELYLQKCLKTRMTPHWLANIWFIDILLHNHLPQNIARPCFLTDLAYVISTTLMHCNQEQRLIVRVMFTTVGDMQGMRMWYPTVYLYCENSNVTSILRLQTLCTSFNICSSTFIKVTDLLPRTNIFSSIYKGPDRVQYQLDDNGCQAEHIDKIDSFWDARYLSAGEAAWRIMGFQVTQKEPAVTSISVHLPQSQSHHQYHRHSGQNSTLSLLDRYFL